MVSSPLARSRASRKELDYHLVYGVKYHKMAKARLVLHTRYIDEVGGLIEMKVYEVPHAPEAPHGFKYSLAYVRNGRRVLGYDNHERKGDHRHVGRLTTPYRFVSVDQLIEDFLEDVTTVRKEKAP